MGWRRRGDVVVRERVIREARYAGLVQPAPPPEAIGALATEDQVLADREVHHEALMDAVGWNACDTEFESVGRRQSRQVVSVDVDGARIGPLHSDEDVKERILAVARHTGDPQNLALVHLDRHLLEGASAGVGRRVQPRDIEHQSSPRSVGNIDRQGDIAADHHPGQVGHTHVGGVGGPNHAAAPKDGHVVRDLHHFMELVGDQHDGQTLGGHAPKGCEEALDAFGRQDRRRLIENQYLDAQIDRLEDLDPLLLPHRQVADRRVDVDFHPVLVTQLL